MKKKYTAPTAEAINFYMENEVAGLTLLSGGNDPQIESDDEILSNKKQNPIWGEQNNGMWNNMK